MKSISSVDATRDGFSFNPYHYIVRQKVLRSFAHLSVGDASEALALMARDVTYTFEGEHALGGTRISRAGVENGSHAFFVCSQAAFRSDVSM